MIDPEASPAARAANGTARRRDAEGRRPAAEARPPSAESAFVNASADLQLILHCPECGAGGAVELGKLKRGLRCRQCRGQFVIGRDGQLRSLPEPPQMAYRCPRCGRAGAVPRIQALRGVLCGACQLPLAPGPDQQLHGAKEAAELHRASAHASRPSESSRSNRRRIPGDSPSAASHRRRFFAALVMLVAGLACSIPFVRSENAGPEAAVTGLVRACLAGDKGGRDYLLDDPLQHAEFRRWWIRRFASIVDAVRPPGDSLSVSVDMVERLPEGTAFRVTLKSPFVGERRHEQVWRRRHGRWKFDAIATLKREDGRSPASRL